MLTARHYSPHDESGIWLDDTYEPSRSVESQTDPSDVNCSCESMNIKITELKQKVAIKTAVVNTQRLEMENHPLISKNKDLNKDLDNMKMEIDLLNKDVDYHKDQLQQEKMNRECSCCNKEMNWKAVQGSDDAETLANGQKGVSNGQHPNIYNLDATMQTYYTKIVPAKYREANRKITQLQETMKQNQKKSDWYKELALSRRADVKRLEAELGKAASTRVSGDKKSE